jgi:hypothetical protein
MSGPPPGISPPAGVTGPPPGIGSSGPPPGVSSGGGSPPLEVIASMALSGNKGLNLGPQIIG